MAMILSKNSTRVSGKDLDGSIGGVGFLHALGAKLLIFVKCKFLQQGNGTIACLQAFNRIGVMLDLLIRAMPLLYIGLQVLLRMIVGRELSLKYSLVMLLGPHKTIIVTPFSFSKVQQ